MQAVHHFNGCCFACAVLTYNGYALALPDMQVQLFIGQGAVWITERGVFEFNAVQGSLPPFKHKAPCLLQRDGCAMQGFARHSHIARKQHCLRQSYFVFQQREV